MTLSREHTNSGFESRDSVSDATSRFSTEYPFCLPGASLLCCSAHWEAEVRSCVPTLLTLRVPLSEENWRRTRSRLRPTRSSGEFCPLELRFRILTVINTPTCFRPSCNPCCARRKHDEFVQLEIPSANCFRC